MEQPSTSPERSPVSTPRPTPAPRGSAAIDGWAHVWFTAQPHRWSTLVIVPATPRFRVSRLAEALATAGRTYGEPDIMLIDATDARPEAIAEIVATGAQRAAARRKTVIAVRSPYADPGAIAIARAADVTLLAVPLGATKIAQARGTIELIGREHFLGAVTVDRNGHPRTES
ncbi:MAG: hypothetical protein HOQ09_02915 [Gemmatimonadaceae bacterium]|nr:hypothetical protein [Gemmatimonadaceae bacterium]